ncbi:MAG TPA: radical SAM protein [Dehalococcoidales bacterium]|nr:radical SAM protein [Dehalococcoidales bacterium]
MSEVQFPYFVDWAVTSKCNLNCRHCRGMLTGEISTGRAKALIAEIAELKPKWVIIEGGEPLLRDDLLELLRLMRQKQLEVHLITNGTLLNHELTTTLKRLGIKVMISIDGATPKTYEEIRRGASFEKVMQAARDCAREGLLEAINFTIMKRNYTEIPGILELAASIGVKQVTLIGLKSCQDYREEIPSPEEYGEAIKLACQAALDTGVDFFFDEPFFWAVVKEWGLPAQLPAESTGILLPSTTACIFGDYIFIEPDGEVKPCSFAPMVLGNVREKSLVQIWKEMLSSPLIRQLKDPQTRSGSCLSCRHLPDCKGCRSRTFVLTDDWFAPDPSCPLRLKPAAREES